MKESYQENTACKIFLWNSLNQNDITKLLALNNYYATVFTEDTHDELLWNVLHHNLLDIISDG